MIKKKAMGNNHEHVDFSRGFPKTSLNSIQENNNVKVSVKSENKLIISLEYNWTASNEVMVFLKSGDQLIIFLEYKANSKIATT